jgi:hypothetical protein
MSDSRMSEHMQTRMKDVDFAWRLAHGAMIVLLPSESCKGDGVVHTLWHWNVKPGLYKVVQIWPGLIVCKLVTVRPGHIWTTWYHNWGAKSWMQYLNRNARDNKKRALKFLQRYCCKLKCCEMWCYVVKWVDADVSKDCSVFVNREKQLVGSCKEKVHGGTPVFRIVPRYFVSARAAYVKIFA